MKEVCLSPLVRLDNESRLMLENLHARINKIRLKNGKKKLGRNAIVSLAIENLTIEMGASK